MSSCLNNLVDITNPWHLFTEAVLPAAACAVASYKIGNYQPDPQVPARRFKPLTAAIYGGMHSLITRLSMDAMCRIGNAVTTTDIKAVVDVIGPHTFVIACAGSVIGALTLSHIVPRDVARDVTGETMDFHTGTLFNLVPNLIKSL
ncbi:MAG: hypothetical protein JSR37_09810 [Verrucomicrobia bacterium]|nr:hypothetical protein [Verrucomicrobiota bacterium]MBS0637863.1 hypothetical protein [Verrucomicrobiota bacterium]